MFKYKVLIKQVDLVNNLHLSLIGVLTSVYIGHHIGRSDIVLSFKIFVSSLWWWSWLLNNSEIEQMDL